MSRTSVLTLSFFNVLFEWKLWWKYEFVYVFGRSLFAYYANHDHNFGSKIYISFSLILNISLIMFNRLLRFKLRWKYECLWFLLLKLICTLNKMYSFNQIQSVSIVFADLQNIRLTAWFVLIEYVDANLWENMNFNIFTNVTNLHIMQI